MADDVPDEIIVQKLARLSQGAVWCDGLISYPTKYRLDTPARANAEKMLPMLKVARVSYCKDQCLWRNDLDKHTPECLEMQSIIAAAEGRGGQDAG